VRQALKAARGAGAGAGAAVASAPQLGSVGAGSGMLCLGRKGGIGSSSRVVATRSMGAVTLGVLTMNNFGGRLRWSGREIAPPRSRGQDARDTLAAASHNPIGGSIIVVLATDAPLVPDILRRVARRAWAGVARNGAPFADTSGDIALAFALPEESGRCPDKLRWRLPTEDANALFLAAADAAEESIWDCLLAAGDFTSPDGKVTPGLRPEELLAVVK
jgi:D-aminopeptidase